MEKSRYRRISKVSAFLLISVALFFDILEFIVDLIPFIGFIFAFIIDVAQMVVFYIWFSMLNIDVSANLRRVASFWVPMIAELLPIPVIDIFLTIGVVMAILITWAEDSVDSNFSGKSNPVNSSKKIIRSKLNQ